VTNYHEVMSVNKNEFVNESDLTLDDQIQFKELLKKVTIGDVQTDEFKEIKRILNKCEIAIP